MQPTVLVAATFDERGREALALGVMLARPIGARLVLASVAPQHGRQDGDVLADQMSELASRAPSDVEISVEVVTSPSPSLLPSLQDLAIEHDAQVLVINPEHRGVIGRSLHGDSTADAVFSATCAVALPARGQAMLAPRLVGVAWSGAQESYEALEWATQFAQRTAATVQIVRVLDPRHPEGSAPDPGVPERMEELREATSPRAQAETRLEWGDAAPVLVELSRDLDLLVLGSRGRGPLRRTLLGSVSTDVVHNAHCPVVVLPRGVHATTSAASAR